MPTAWLWMSIIDVMSTSLEIIQGMMEMAEENNPNLEREIEMGSGTLPYKPLSAASTIARKSGQSSLSLRCCPVEPWSPISTSPQQQQWIRSKNKVIISVRCSDVRRWYLVCNEASDILYWHGFKEIIESLVNATSCILCFVIGSFLLSMQWCKFHISPFMSNPPFPATQEFDIFCCTFL